MDFRRLRYFTRIAQDGSLTRAAGVLGIAQPALSRQMRLLEQEVGAPLFRRTPRGVTLTEAGDRLLAAIAAPLRDIDAAVRDVGSQAGQLRGDFTIGMPPGIGPTVGRRLVPTMTANHPAVRLRLVDGNTGSLQDWLARGVIDFALLEEPATDARLSQTCVLRQSLRLVQRPGSAAPGNVALADLARLPLILPSHHLGARRSINAAAAAAGLLLHPVVEVDDPRLAAMLVHDGIGCALLAPCQAPTVAGDEPLSCRPIADPGIPYRLHLASRPRPHPHEGQAGSRFRDLLLAELTEAFA